MNNHTATEGATMNDTNNSLPPAGWYPDPHQTGSHRYWDGRSWSDMVQVPMATDRITTGYLSADRIAANQADPMPQQMPQWQSVPSGQGFAITSLILGIMGMILAVAGLLGGPVAIILGSISISRSQKRMEKITTAVWGVVLGSLSFLYAVFVLLLL